jgi:hypothetical protein
MRNLLLYLILTFLIFTVSFKLLAQTHPVNGDPPNDPGIPSFFKSRLSDVDAEIKQVQKGTVEKIATSPGGFPVYAVFYGENVDLQSQANYNSAVAARDVSYYAKKDPGSSPSVFFLGPVHGHEVEGMAGLLNLIHIGETGKDHRGKAWPMLKEKIDQCRIIIIPLANPDGRRRCPYDGFVGLPTEIMTKYGQGTRKDGSFYGWPGAKAVHPMKGDVGILGSYFNDNGINLMHDEFFAPMAAETKAILMLASAEAPDLTVSLHSHENYPVILQPAHVPWYIKELVYELALNVNQRYQDLNLPHRTADYIPAPAIDDKIYPPTKSFNLVSALHHVSGTMSFTFECSHGSISGKLPDPIVNYEDILDIQLYLYAEILDYAINRWEN